MGFKRLIKKELLGGAGCMIEGHIRDAIQKKKETGKSFRECLSESVKETFTEDLPGTSHVYQKGKTNGRKQVTAEQAKRDETKIRQMCEDHERDRQEWKKIDKEKDELLEEMENNQ
jgi:transcriptional regulator of heat shock response